MNKRTKNDFFDFLWALFLLAVFCGKDVLIAFLKALKKVLVDLFPTLLEFTLESYFTSPSFIVGVVVFVLSILGFYVSHKTQQKMIEVLSLIMALISIFSFGNGIFY